MPSPTVHELQQRITQMQRTRLPERTLPTHPGLRPLLPGGAIRAGSSYTVQGSWQLALAFLTEASQTGAWCGVIGCPAFGAEAAATLGLALDRCILMPHPGADAITLAGTLSEILTITLLYTPTPPPTGAAERIAARLREHGSSLIVAGPWSGVTGSFTVTSSRWEGTERGFGNLHTRTLSVTGHSSHGTTQHTLRFVDGVLAAGTGT